MIIPLGSWPQLGSTEQLSRAPNRTNSQDALLLMLSQVEEVAGRTMGLWSLRLAHCALLEE